MLVGAAVVAGGLVAWQLADPRSPSIVGAETLTYNDYELQLPPGIGYDVDIPPGRPPEWHATRDHSSPDYRYLDLYRTARGTDHLGGVDLSPFDGHETYNQVQQVGADDDPARCLRLAPKDGGNVKVADMEPGTRICLRTHDARWAMLTVLELPENRQAPLLLRVQVLAR